MAILSKRLFGMVARDYRKSCGLGIGLSDPEGRIILPEACRPIENLPALRRLRRHNLDEAVRWGEPQVYFAAPGILSWIIALVDASDLRGGLCGGYIPVEDDPHMLNAAVNYLVGEGARRSEARSFVQALPPYEQGRVREAVDLLHELFYRYSGWKPLLLRRNRDRMLQQRQIAEEIHQRKVEQNRAYPYDDERKLLSLIRVGDRAGARSMFNRMLAAMFLYSPKPVVVRARAIEMMGYLVRAAVEDSPLMEPLLERHTQWIERIVDTGDFDDLCLVLREALDDFMNSIFLQGVRPEHPAVRRALAYIAENYTEPVSLDQIAQAAGLSTFRIAHLLKENTGRTALQNVHYHRVQEARRLLEESDLSCTEIAYETGFGDQSYFIRQFRRWMGITPARYRRAARG